jgi:DNA adenine methylase
MEKPWRQLLRWLGAKFVSGDWIISHFPVHRVYTEVYGGSAAVFMKKEPASIEIINDLDSRVHAFYICLRDETLSRRLARMLEYTSFGRNDYNKACEPTRREDFASEGDWAVETARRACTVGMQAFGNGKSSAARSGWRDHTGDSRTAPVLDWPRLPEVVDLYHQRFKAAMIEHADALRIIRRHDYPDTLHYVDPPYVPESRTSFVNTGYKHDMILDDHERLLDVLQELRGMVVLSGYCNDLYDKRLADWTRDEREFVTNGRTPRVECVWLNPACAAALKAEKPGDLFDPEDWRKWKTALALVT